MGSKSTTLQSLAALSCGDSIIFQGKFSKIRLEKLNLNFSAENGGENGANIFIYITIRLVLTGNLSPALSQLVLHNDCIRLLLSVIFGDHVLLLVQKRFHSTMEASNIVPLIELGTFARPADVRNGSIHKTEVRLARE